MELTKEEYRLIIESSPNMIWRSGLDALCNYFNETWLKFTGKTMDQEVGIGWAEGVHPEDYDTCLATYLEAFAKHVPFEMDYRLTRNDGEYRWINDMGAPCFNKNHEFVGYVGSCIDINDIIEGQKMRDLAQNDGLTGIFNRQYFEQLANNEFNKAQRFKTDLCIGILDIDQFKKINDTYGHHGGDLILKEVAKALKNGIREFDICGRYGGDEFIFLLTSTDYEQAGLLVKRLREDFDKIKVKSEDEIITTHASFGIHQISWEDTLEKAIIDADKKLYEEKRRKYKSEL
jgi:diguanylate cyclase (GGDEF)-like protein/PAS domain S-box-containing protein